MADSKTLNNLVINKVESQEVYDYMSNNGLINEDELYLIEGEDQAKIVVDDALSASSENPVQNKVITSALGSYETKTDSQVKLNEAKSYADSVGSTVKNDLLNGAGEAYDTLKELGDLIDENSTALEALETVATGKQDKLTGVEGQVVIFDADGEATAQDFPQSVYLITATDNSGVGEAGRDLIDFNHTFDEIYEAYTSGKTVVLQVEDVVLQLNQVYYDSSIPIGNMNFSSTIGDYQCSHLNAILLRTEDFENQIYASYTSIRLGEEITGTPGQVVGFDENGNAVAQNIQGGGTIDEDTLANLELITLEDIDEICYVIPPNTFQKVRSLQNGKEYILLFDYNDTYYCVGNEAFNDWTVKAYSVPEVTSTDKQITFTTVPTLFTAIASGDGFILNNGSNSITGEASSGGTSLKVNDSTGTIFSVDTSATGGFDNDEIIAKADNDAIWLRAMLNEQNCCLKFEEANTSIGIDYKDRNETYSTGFLSFVLYEKIS